MNILTQTPLLFLRYFKRNKSSFIINLTGLSIGLSCTLLIYLWVSDELNVDKFHEKDQQLYSVIQNIELTGEISTLEVGPNPVAKTLVAEMPEVESAVSVFEIQVFGKPNLSYKEKKIKANCIYAGDAFFSIFSYNLLHGDPSQALSDINSIVISDEIAQKLFGSTQNVIGEIINFQNQSQYVVRGIFEKVPGNSTLQFDFVLPNEVLARKYPSMDRWESNSHNTYVVLKKGANVAQLNDKIHSLIERKCGEANRTLFLKPYSDKYLYSAYEDGVQKGGRIEYVRIFIAIAIFILLMACVNFISLSTARASDRTKEIGVKKVLGASRLSLAFQYLSESIMMAFLSLLMAIFLVTLFLPWFNNITGKQILLTFNVFNVLFFIGIAMISGFIAGSYPAIYFSAFNPIGILKKKFHGSKGELWIRKGLVVFQFVLSTILIVSVLVISKQIEYIQSKHLGIEKDNVMYFDMEGRVSENVDAFISEVKNIPGIINASSTMFNILGKHNITGGVSWGGKSPNDRIDFHMQFVNYDFIETLGIKLNEGRTFSREFGAENSRIICNQAAIDIMGFKDPIGETVTIGSEEKQIVGVTQNFHYESLHESVNPLIFSLAQPSQNLKIMVNMETGTERETIERLSTFYKKYNPGFAFEYTFLDQYDQAKYVSENRVGVISRYFAGIAIMISCLGLFGLATFSAEKRTREIGIRKVMGSSSSRIVYLMSADFTIQVVISIIIALPIGYIFIKNWLSEFAYTIDLNIWYFLGAGLLTIIIVWLTIGVQVFKAANSNPAKCLRYE